MFDCRPWKCGNHAISMGLVTEKAERRSRPHSGLFTGGVLLLAIYLSSCSGDVSDRRTSEARQRGQGLYALWCAPCHEANDLHLVKEAPRLAGLFLQQTLPSGAASTDEQVRKTISEGRGIMPPFRRTLNQDEVDDLMQFLHSFKRNAD